MQRKFCSIVALGGLLAGCMVGPDYHRPPVPVPHSTRNCPAGRRPRRRMRPQGRLVDRFPRSACSTSSNRWWRCRTRPCVRTTPTTSRHWPRCRWRAASCFPPWAHRLGHPSPAAGRRCRALQAPTSGHSSGGDHRRLARGHCELDARSVGSGAPPDRGASGDRAGRRGDPGQRHSVRADLAGHHRHRVAAGRCRHRSAAEDGRCLSQMRWRSPSIKGRRASRHAAFGSHYRARRLGNGAGQPDRSGCRPRAIRACHRGAGRQESRRARHSA